MLEQLSRPSELPSITGEFWETLKTQSVDRPINLPEAKSRTTQAQLAGYPLNIFVPWGIAPNGTITSKVQSSLWEISRFTQNLLDQGVSTQVLIMPADVYATGINGGDLGTTIRYSQEIASLAGSLGFETKPWSQIRSENLSEYQRAKNFLSPDIIAKEFPSRALFKAVEAARTRSSFRTEAEVRQAALDYIQERIIEARIINRTYKPIKYSMVSSRKDIFDGYLPRVYLLPKSLRFPWLD